MPNVLVLSLEGFSFSSRQMYQHLLPKLLSRATVHESCTIKDAQSYISSSWPSIILVSDSVIAQQTEESIRLLNAVSESTKHGCITVLMGFFAESIEHERLNQILQGFFHLPWKVEADASHPVTLRPNLNSTLIRYESLPRQFNTKALWLCRVPPNQIIYFRDEGKHRNDCSVYAAFARIGLGKLGYIGDHNFEEEPERLILAMSHLDRPEEYIVEDIGRYI